MSKQHKMPKGSAVEAPAGVSCPNDDEVFFSLERHGLPTPAEQLQQLADWLSERSGAPPLISLTIEDLSAFSGPQAWEGYLGALQAVLAAPALPPLLSLHLSTSACCGSQLDAGGLFQLPSMDSLSLELGSVPAAAGSLPQLGGSLALLPQLTSLRLVGWELRAAQQPPRLRELALFGGSCPEGGLGHLTQLTQLSLLHSQAGTQLPPSLQRLVLLGCPPRRVPLDSKTNVPRCAPPRLRALGIAGASRGPLDPASLARHTQLTSLRLESCVLNEESEAGLEPLQHLTRLELVDCRHAGGEGVLGLPRLPALQELVLENCRLTHLYICGLEAITMVRVIADRQLESVVMRGLPSLRYARLAGLPRLQEVNIRMELPTSAWATKEDIGGGLDGDEISEDSERSDEDGKGGGSDEVADCAGSGGEATEDEEGSEEGSEEYSDEDEYGEFFEGEEEEEEEAVNRVLHFPKG